MKQQRWWGFLNTESARIEAMDDDANTADAIAAIFELVREVNTHVKPETALEYLQKAHALLMELTGVLGILAKAKGSLDEEIEVLIAERQEARKAKNFARSDEIRDLLKEKNVVLEDTPSRG